MDWYRDHYLADDTAGRAIRGVSPMLAVQPRRAAARARRHGRVRRAARRGRGLCGPAARCRRAGHDDARARADPRLYARGGDRPRTARGDAARRGRSAGRSRRGGSAPRSVRACARRSAPACRAGCASCLPHLRALQAGVLEQARQCALHVLRRDREPVERPHRHRQCLASAGRSVYPSRPHAAGRRAPRTRATSASVARFTSGSR